MRTDERRERPAPPIQRILAVLAGVVLLRIFLRHGPLQAAGRPGGTRRDRRRAMIARLHRELHEADATAAATPEVTA